MDTDILALIDEIEIPAAPEWIEHTLAPVSEWNGKTSAPLITFNTEAELKDKIEGVIVWNEADHKFSWFRSHADLEDFIYSSQSRTFHERIYEKQTQKIRFDIDAKAEVMIGGKESKHTLTLENLDEIRDEIVGAFNATYISRNQVMIGWDDLIICDSSDQTKRSVHIIIKGYHVINNVEAAAFAQLVKRRLPPALQPFLDMGIYKSATGLRLPLNHKAGSTRVKRLPIGVLFEDALITATEKTVELAPIATEPEERESVGGIICTNADVHRILAQIPAEMLEGLVYRNMRGSFINFTRTAASACPISGEIHHTDNTVYVFAMGKNIFLKCRHCGGPKLIAGLNQTAHMRPSMAKKIEEFIAKEAVEDPLNADSKTEYNERYMREYENVDTLGVKAPMGAGKSQQLRKVIGQMVGTDVTNNGAIIRAISFRRSFTQEMKNTYGLDSYQNIEGVIDERYSRVIVQCESLNRLKPVAPTLLVIDEIESVLNQFYAKTMKNYGACWAMFKYLVRTARKVIFMDAMLTQRSIDVIKGIRERPIHLHLNNVKLMADSTHSITMVESVAVKRILNALDVNKRVVIPTTSAKLAKSLHKMLKGKYPTKDFLLYTGETPEDGSQKKKKKLKTFFFF